MIRTKKNAKTNNPSLKLLVEQELEKQKSNFKRANAILCADFHISETQPVSRTDDFMETQLIKLDFIKELQKLHLCLVLHAGDLFDYWKPSPKLLSDTILHLPDNFYTILGNHDLPQHNLDLLEKSGVYTLHTANKLDILEGQPHWGQDAKDFQDIKEYCGRPTLIWHTMNYQGLPPWPGCTSPKALKLLKMYPQYDLILTGHNHIPFVEELDGRILVNPGSIFRTTADQINHKPRVYLWYAETNTVKPVFIPILDNVINREHLDVVQQKNNRIDAFISSINKDWENKLTFEENLQEYIQANPTRKSVIDLIHEAMESE